MINAVDIISSNYNLYPVSHPIAVSEYITISIYSLHLSINKYDEC